MLEKQLVMTQHKLVLVTWLLSGALIGCTPSDSPHLKDDQLLRLFAENRLEFERLAEDLGSECKKGLTRIDVDWTDPEDPKRIGIFESQIERYRERLKNLGISRGYSAAGSCNAMELIVSTQGLAVSGSSKGYYYSEQPPRHIVPSLDVYSPEFKYGAYRRVIDRWYLYYSE